MVSRTVSPSSEPSSPLEGGIRKRVCKACDRCRLKKSKCDGSTPCSRCKADNAICVFGERKKSHDKVYPKGYVEMLEGQQAQLVSGIQELYRRLQTGEGWTGPQLKPTARGTPLTHDILERLGALKSDRGDSEHFEENPEALQSTLLASGAGYMPHDYSLDANSETELSPVFEPEMYHKTPPFTNPWTHQFPPTPPVGSPHPNFVKTSSPLKAEMMMPTAQYPAQSQWPAEAMGFGSMDYNATYESATFEANMQAADAGAQMYNNISGMAINPCLTIKDWYGPDDDRIQHQHYGIST